MILVYIIKLIMWIGLVLPGKVVRGPALMDTQVVQDLALQKMRNNIAGLIKQSPNRQKAISETFSRLILSVIGFVLLTLQMHKMISF